MIESDDHIDKSQWLPSGEPIITPERGKKGDVFTGPSCEDCGGSGKSTENTPCRECRGRGWIGSVNTASMVVSDIKFAQVQVRNILNFLWNQGIIDDQQHDDGCTFEAWRNQHRIAMGQQRAMIAGNEVHTQAKLRAYGFVLIIQRLSANDTKDINFAIDTSTAFDNIFFRPSDRIRYRTAFIHLSTVFPAIRDRIAYLESLSDEERAAISDERLKKFIDGIVKSA